MARNTANYLGRVPAVKGTGPKNLAKNGTEAVNQVRTKRPTASRASSPRVSPARASAGYGSPPGGGAGGIPKATSPMASAPSKTINKPKTGRPGRGLGTPKADFPSKI